MAELVRRPETPGYYYGRGSVDVMSASIWMLTQAAHGAVVYGVWTDPNVDYTLYASKNMEGHPGWPYVAGAFSGGLYAQEVVAGGKRDALAIGLALDELARDYPIDLTRPRIEVYTDSDDVIVLSPVAEGVNP